ncbi:hypothetical protein OG562_05105 [Streptomyces sp. NBC_01275]|uniref:hypothetical protein n=1 Tax=Streptomyces sp. NBC_01275 TaxID=2903807 RepID=UPI0022530698|nr:hypothetical protein [Streptomyces sp. NBC_01275]MCX4760369.1 hypothetical protein [Streptomyces sp. NBC_01275]
MGEVSARAWLERRYAEVRRVSGYAAVLDENAAASDGHGHGHGRDFEVACRGTTHLYEVKATSESDTERMDAPIPWWTIKVRHSHRSKHR